MSAYRPIASALTGLYGGRGAVEQFQREEPTSQLLTGDRAVALRRRNLERTLAGLLDRSMDSAFAFIAPLLVSCSTGSAPTSV